MDGFKNSTKTQYFTGGSVMKAAGGELYSPKPQPTVAKPKTPVRHSETGIPLWMQLGQPNPNKPKPTPVKPPIVAKPTPVKPRVAVKPTSTQTKVAQVAAMLNKGPRRMNNGGSVEADDALMARMTPKELAMGRAGIAAARARLSGKKAPSKAVPVASKRPMVESKNGGPVKMNNGGPVASTGATTATPRPPSALLQSLNPQKYQQAQAARAAAATPAAKAAARAKATANVARDAALKTSMTQNAQQAAVRKQRSDATAAAYKNTFMGKQAEINKMKAANAASMAQNNQKRAANATARAANQARQVQLNQQKAANDAAMAARTPVKKASGGLAAMPKGKC
jgi:hypothetical protein